MDTLNSEKKYFGKSLDLYKQIDLNRWVAWTQAPGEEWGASNVGSLRVGAGLSAGKAQSS